MSRQLSRHAFEASVIWMSGISLWAVLGDTKNNNLGEHLVGIFKVFE